MLVVLVIALSLTFLGGCSTNGSGPVTDPNQSKLDWLNETIRDDNPELGPGINITTCPVLYDTTLSATVDWRGYQLNMIHGVETIGFSLPWMAVIKSTTLTIRVRKLQAPFGEFWMLDCGPGGQVFNFPLYVQPNPQVTSKNKSVLFYFNPSTGLWEVQEVAKQSSPQIPIYHFSKYGISN